MFAVSSLLLALAVAAVLGALGTVYFWTISRRRDEAETGIRALSAMRWREFSHFVLDAMRHRGFDVLTHDDEAERGQQTEFLLSRNGERALLSCKHGSAYKLTPQQVAEFAASMKFQGANTGLLVTPGTIEADARKPAESAGIELIDGGKLWPEIEPLLPRSLAEDVRHAAAHRARRQVSLAWIGAVVAGLAIGIVIGGNAPTAPVTTPTPLAATPTTPAEVAAPVTVPALAAEAVDVAPPATAPMDVPPAVASTPAEEDLQRAEVVRLVSTLPGVERALWSTKSTLLVHVDATTTERFDEICSVLVPFANLRTSRVHLQPPPESQQRVRFKQCQTY
jgi:hypothetical protein